MSKDAIEASENLSLHARMIERAMSMMDHMAKRRPHSDEDDMVLEMLAARLFNSGASAMKLLMGGFYQTAVMVMRDILIPAPEQHESAYLLAGECGRGAVFGI